MAKSIKQVQRQLQPVATGCLVVEAKLANTIVCVSPDHHAVANVVREEEMRTFPVRVWQWKWTSGPGSNWQPIYDSETTQGFFPGADSVNRKTFLQLRRTLEEVAERVSDLPNATKLPGRLNDPKLWKKVWAVIREAEGG